MVKSHTTYLQEKIELLIGKKYENFAFIQDLALTFLFY